jgi:hypothetical protein
VDDSETTMILTLSFLQTREVPTRNQPANDMPGIPAIWSFADRASNYPHTLALNLTHKT